MQSENSSYINTMKPLMISAVLIVIGLLFFVKIEKLYEFNPNRFQFKEIHYLYVGSFTLNIKIGEKILDNRINKWLLGKGLIGKGDDGLWYPVYGKVSKVSFVYKDMFEYGDDESLFTWCLENEQKAKESFKRILDLMKKGDFENASILWMEISYRP